MCTAKWIWQNKNALADEHAEFFTIFSYNKEDGKAELFISADSEYGVFINGKIVYYGQYHDYSHYKIYDRIDITEYLKDGENALAVEGWYFGEGSLVYAKGEAGVCFAVCCANKELCVSGKHILSRLSRTYLSHKKKKITTQLGFSYTYDATQEDDWKTQGADGFVESVEFERALPIIERPILRLETETGRAGTRIKKEKNRWLFDFGEELVGVLHLRFISKDSQNIKVCWGEHIADGWVRDVIAYRDFSLEYKAKIGQNNHTGYYRRLGLRYAEIRFESEPEDLTVEILQRPYPLKEKPYVCNDNRLQKIYDVCIRTLKLCMHEHYEDCPWREQALYAMDSRNQMLCGYYAFEEYAFARACLKLMSQDRRADGLLSITYPSNGTGAIPSFSLHYFTQVKEYGDYSGDWSLAEEVFPKLKSVLDVFLQHKGEQPLISTFAGQGYWNFYEWSDGLKGKWNEPEAKNDLILNCLLSLALQNMAYICDKLNKSNDYANQAQRLNKFINQAFFDEDNNCYALYAGSKEYKELGNALAVLCGAANEQTAKAICDILASDNEWTKISLSMKCFKYDALLKTNEKKYRSYILNDIKKVYGKMLECGATSVWETEKGQSDFDNAGSLCHGWSAMPVYYFHRLHA